MSLSHFNLATQLTERQQQQRFRQCKTHDSAQGSHLLLDGRDYLNFSSNDYLGLANHPLVKQAFIKAAEKYGVGSGSAHLVCGHHKEHQALEEELAAFTGREAAILFSTGYMANVGVINALVGRGDFVVEDRLNHASLLDGGLSSGASFGRYQHNDTADLSRRLAQSSSAKKLIVSDGVFSMDGDMTLIPELVHISQQQQAALMIDDAHGFGVLGKTGAGIGEYFGCSAKELPIYMATFGKALGTFGAFVSGSRALIDYLTNFARPYIYTTAMPPAIAAATRQSLKLLEAENWRRDYLQQLIQRFRQGVIEQGWPLMASQTAIQPILLGEESKALALSQALAARGFWVTAIRPPTVPVGQSRLRVTLTASHSEADIDCLLNTLAILRTDYVNT
ncbi:MAG: 8-amino-7-oxononanoate synthase [Moraxellaceae bacterium]|nr:8-amino-7-oxononanoate synthase [Moraxellaceae bacterium]